MGLFKDLYDIADALDLTKPATTFPEVVFNPKSGRKKADKLSSAIHNIFSSEEACKEPIPGTPVYCNLAVIAEHTGIYIGNKQIVHLNGDGNIEVVSPSTFVGRLDGLNPAFFIYYATFKGKALGSQKVAERAKAMVGNSRNYNFLLDNCHQFTTGCISGNFENACNFFWMVEDTIREHHKGLVWQPWFL
jgi:hypothetical protein